MRKKTNSGRKKSEKTEVNINTIESIAVKDGKISIRRLVLMTDMKRPTINVNLISHGLLK